MTAARHRVEKGAPTKALPDDQEQWALASAAAKLKTLCPSAVNAEAIACAVISDWIIQRCKMASGVRLNETVVFNLGDAKLRGYIEAALPQIADGLGSIDLSRPIFDLSKEEIVSVFAAGCIGANAAAVALGESEQFAFDDAVPFGAKPKPFEAFTADLDEEIPF